MVIHRTEENRQEEIRSLSQGVKGGTKRRPRPPLLTKYQARLTTYPAEWTADLRRSIRRRDKNLCQVCRVPIALPKTHIHHINFDKADCWDMNLITLCAWCHTATNRGRQRWYEDLFYQMSCRFPDAE